MLRSGLLAARLGVLGWLIMGGAQSAAGEARAYEEQLKAGCGIEEASGREACPDQ